jgi:hypothetical protein
MIITVLKKISQYQIVIKKISQYHDIVCFLKSLVK